MITQFYMIWDLISEIKNKINMFNYDLTQVIGGQWEY